MSDVFGLPRGIPAASLKPRGAWRLARRELESSAGNTRGLIEALAGSLTIPMPAMSSAGNTRGLIEA